MKLQSFQLAFETFNFSRGKIKLFEGLLETFFKSIKIKEKNQFNRKLS